MNDARPLAPPFHQHIAKSKMMDKTFQVGDQVLIYDIVATEPDGAVQINCVTQFQFE
ncbi:MAG: hypothetical protein ACYSPI_14025 [Planctomycetota bacterium]|jgi:hypothetical protein